VSRDAAALKDPAVYSLHNAVADAAVRVWHASSDPYMRDLALEIDRNLTRSGNAPIAVLRRYAEVSESTGDKQAALDCWRLLLSGTNPTAPEWFEARYHSLRLLAALDPTRLETLAVRRRVAFLHADQRQDAAADAAHEARIDGYRRLADPLYECYQAAVFCPVAITRPSP
jgi:hypothetical protein